MRRTSTSDRRQQGAAAVFVAIALIPLLIATMLAIEVGRVYYAHRDLQKAANLAALDAARLMSGCNGDDLPTQTMLDNAAATSLTRNNVTGVTGTVVEAGDVMTGDDKVRYLDPVDITDTSAMTNAHAVRVTVSQPFPTPLIPFFASSGRVMTTSATAEQAALGSLYVGSTLLDVSGGVLNAVLSGLLGGSVNLNAVDYQGLAGVNVSLGQLATAVGVDVSDLSDPLALTTQTPVLSSVLNGLAGSLSGTTSTTVTNLLQNLASAASGNSNGIPLGNVLGTVDNVAANVPFVNLLDLIMALGAASHPSGSVIPISASGIGLTVPGTVTLKTFIKVLEPAQPSGLGRAGQTSAHTAQISLMIRIEGGGLLNGLSTTLTNTINAALGLLNLVGITSTVNVLSPPLNIGIDVDVAKATASLDSIECPSLAHQDPIAGLSATPALASVALGTFSGSANSAPALDPSTTNWNVATVSVDATAGCIGIKLGNACVGVPVNLGSTNLKVALSLTGTGVGGGTSIPLDDVTDFTLLNPSDLPGNAPPTWLADGFPPAAAVSDNPQTVGSGNEISLNLGLTSSQTGSGLTGILGGLVSSLVSTVTTALQPLLNIVNSLVLGLVDPLLSALGIHIGTATVMMDTVTIGQPRIVSTAVPGTNVTP